MAASSTSGPAPARPGPGSPTGVSSSRPTSNPWRWRCTANATQRGAVVAADASALPFADCSFDAVLCVTVLYHQAIVSPRVAVAEMARVVRPGGIVCLLEPGVRRLRRAHDRVTHAGRRFSVRDVAGLLATSGLDVERATGAYSFLVPPAALKMVLERGETASDLDENGTGLRGVLPGLASAERRLLRRASLPFGLSVVAIGRRG